MALSTGGMDPGNSHTVFRIELSHFRPYTFDPSDDLMTQNDRERGLNPPFNFVELGVANPTDGNLHQNLFGPGNGIRYIHHLKGSFFDRHHLVKDHCFHLDTLSE